MDTSFIDLKQRAAFLGLFMNFYTAFEPSSYHTEILREAETLFQRGQLLNRVDYSNRESKVVITYNRASPYIAWDVSIGAHSVWRFIITPHSQTLSWNNQTLMTKDQNSLKSLAESEFTKLFTTTQRVLRLYLEKKKVRVPILLRK